MAHFEYEHTFIQHLSGGHNDPNAIPIDVKDGLDAWGADGWEVVHMEAAWDWHRGPEGNWPEHLRGYYVTFKRQADADGGARRATAMAEIEVGEAASPTTGGTSGPTVGEMMEMASRSLE